MVHLYLDDYAAFQKVEWIISLFLAAFLVNPENKTQNTLNTPREFPRHTYVCAMSTLQKEAMRCTRKRNDKEIKEQVKEMKKTWQFDNSHPI